MVDALSEKLPKVATTHLDNVRTNLFALTAFPKQIWSNSPEERLNKEIRRRTYVVGSSPTTPRSSGLVGAVLAEQHDEWIEGRCYSASTS